ncbi:MAG: ABC transporter substrate-binding protein [Gammaproteobacteria bacterium]|nr:ABC transporter substrate-binding protein [Gammaproteobacteria bacterium]
MSITLLPKGLLQPRFIVLLAALFSTWASYAMTVVPGVSENRIRLGMTATYKGGVGEFAGLADAMRAYLASLSGKGGIGGKAVDLIITDDNMQAYRTKRIVNGMLKKKMILAVVGSIGGRTNSTTARILNEREVPHLFFSSWRGDLDSPEERPWSMTLIPHPQVAGAAIGRYLAARKAQQVAVLYPAGAHFAERSIAGLEEANSTLQLEKVPFGIAIEELDARTEELIRLKPDVVLNLTFGQQLRHSAARIAASLPAAPQVFGLDLWTAREVAATAAQVSGATFIVPSIVKNASSNDADTETFSAWLEGQSAELKARRGDPAVVYGYVTGQLVEHVLRQANENGFGRASLMRAAQALKGLRLPMLADGLSLETSATDHNPADRMVFRQLTAGTHGAGPDWSDIGVW